MDNNHLSEKVRSALTLVYRMGLLPVGYSSLWNAVHYSHPNFERWGEQWGSGEVRESLEVLRGLRTDLEDADSGETEEIDRIVEELATLDTEGADIYSGRWYRGETIIYTERGVEEFLREFYYETEGSNLLYYVDFGAMARDSILSGDWERVASISKTYYVRD